MELSLICNILVSTQAMMTLNSMQIIALKLILLTIMYVKIILTLSHILQYFKVVKTHNHRRAPLTSPLKLCFLLAMIVLAPLFVTLMLKRTASQINMKHTSFFNINVKFQIQNYMISTIKSVCAPVFICLLFCYLWLQLSGFKSKISFFLLSGIYPPLQLVTTPWS